MDRKDEIFLKKLLATFRVEAAEHVAAISSGLIELEKSPSPERQTGIIEAVFRESHSMKGAARAVNLQVIEGVCQSFEGVLSALKRKDIVPAPDLLDLLHRAVNVLEALLSEDVPHEKAGIKELVGRLDNAAGGGRSGGGTEADAEKRTKVQSAAPNAAPPSAECEPPVRTAAVDTMRISKQRLDSILLQAEGLLSLKQLMTQRATELRGVVEEVAALRKEWEKIRPDMRRAADAAKKNGGSPPVGKLLDFLEEKGESLTKLHASLAAVGKASDHDNRSVASMVDSLLEDLKTVSMLPFSSLLEIMPRVVRDLAHDRGKEATLNSSGGETEIDRRILDEMKEPLIHIVRNCIDHGIEMPGERAAVNKPRAGTIAIDVANREGKTVEIVVRDDGAGLDVSKIRNSTVRLGLFSGEEAERMDEARLFPLIFRSGVTTSPIITDISGRGLGLAIVQEKVERLGGSVFCETSGGKGTAFRIFLPLSLATFRGVLVQVGERRFIIPITGIDRTVRIGRDEIRTVENRETIAVGGRAIPFVPLRLALELPHGQKEGTDAEFVQAAILGTAEHRIAFGVDDIGHEQEVLVKNLGKQLARVRNVAGATVLGTGQVVPVLNVSDLLKSAVRVSPGAEAPSRSKEAPARKSVLVAEDSITARTLLKNILESAGYDVRTAVDGVDAFTILKTGRFDIVVSDIDMPRMNGLDLTAKIRSDRALSEIPVVLVTALESREDRERGIDVGANAYIVKSSFDQSNLLEAMRRLL